MARPSEQHTEAAEQLATVVDVLASTAERMQLFRSQSHGQVFVEPLSTTDPMLMYATALETIAIGSELIAKLGGLSLVYEDGITGHETHALATCITGYSVDQDTWKFATTPFGITLPPKTFLSVACTTPELREASRRGAQHNSATN